MGPQYPISRAGIAIGAGLLVLAVIIAADAARMQVPPSYARIGPQVFPFAVALGLAAVGAYFTWSSWAAGAPREVVGDGQPTDWRSLLLICVGLVIHLLLLKTLGFIVVSTGLFVVIAIAFGSRRYLRDAAIGLALAVFAYLGFTRMLGLQLPAGVFIGLM